MRKRGFVWQGYIVGLIIAISLLVLGVLIVFVLRERGIGAIDYIKNIFRFGR